MVTKKQKNSSRKSRNANRPNHSHHQSGVNTLVHRYEFSKTFAEAIVDFANKNMINLAYRNEWVAASSLTDYKRQGGTKTAYDAALSLLKDGDKGNGFLYKTGGFFLYTAKRFSGGSNN